MELSDDIILDILDKSEKLIEKKLNSLSDNEFSKLVCELNNLSDKEKEINFKLVCRINFLKAKNSSHKIDNTDSEFSSGELDILNKVFN